MQRMNQLLLQKLFKRTFIRMKALKQSFYLLLSFFYLLLPLIYSQTICNLSNCSTCDATFTNCLVCLHGYMLDISGNCLQCNSPCATCSTSTTYCDSCIDSNTNPVSGLCPQNACNSALNQYFDHKTFSCLPCNNIIPSCTICSQYLPTTTICLSCFTGYYLDRSLLLCLPCANGCSYCNNGGTCGSCYPGLIFANSLCFCTKPGQMYDLVNKKCVTCTLGCIKCSGMNTCSTCDSVNGWSLSGNICINCNSFCTNCGSNGCITCQKGYQPVGGQCKTCALALPNPGCVQCQQTQCKKCLTTGYFMNTTTSLCQTIACNSSQTAVGGVCRFCSSLYDIHCTQCNINSCTFCTNGYVYNTSTLKCELRRVFGCGDGFWIETVEKCDDWNSVNGDGCDANCQPQLDYVCDVADKQPIGTSLCKYTRDFHLTMDHIHKGLYSNTAHLFFTIEPAGFLQWTSQELLSLLSPIQITDLSTGNVVSVSFKQVSFNFQRVDGVNRFQIIIDSYQKNVENSYFKVIMNFSQTSIQSIKSKTVPEASIVQLNSDGNGVPLFFYSEEMYNLQNFLKSVCAFIGYLSMVLIFVGFMIPAGKLIIVQAMCVVQITFFSVLQFKNIPPTYVGFKELGFSSGYNIPLVVESSTPNIVQQQIYGLMGVSDNVIDNCNISFILLIFIPAFFSMIGYFIARHMMKLKLAENAEIKQILMEIEKGQAVNINSEEEMLYKLRANIFKRILFEVSFYGLMITGYLAWVSVFKSFSSFSLSNLIFSILILGIWIAYAVIFIRTKTGKFNLNAQSRQKQQQTQNQNISMLRFFGQFKSIYEQISKKNSQQSHPIQKVYIIFMVERILVSVFIVYLAPLFSYVSVIIIVLYTSFLFLLVFCHRRLQSISDEERLPLCLHLYQNYTLRQCVNFITILFIQLIFFIQQVNYSSLTLEQAMATNQFTTKMAPILVVFLLMFNLLFNLFLWIWQVKGSLFLIKGQLVIKILTYKKPQQKGKGKLKKNSDKGEPYIFQTEEKEHLKPIRRRQQEIDEIIRAHNSGAGDDRMKLIGAKENVEGCQKIRQNCDGLKMMQENQVTDEI